MQLRKGLVLAAVLASAAALGGCGGYDVELKGGVFDLMGVSGTQNKKAKEPNLRARPGLVVPPSTAALPEPGSGAQPTTAPDGQAWPVDPEKTKVAKNEALRKQHEAFCAKARQRVDAGLDTVLPDGPLGSCHQSIIKNFTGKPLYRQDADPR